MQLTSKLDWGVGHIYCHVLGFFFLIHLYAMLVMVCICCFSMRLIRSTSLIVGVVNLHGMASGARAH